MFVSLLATFGLSLVMQQFMNVLYGPEVQIIDSKLPVYSMFDDFVTVPMAKIISLILAGTFALIIVIFMKKSRMGQAIRATAQDARAARVLGINTDRVYKNFNQFIEAVMSTKKESVEDVYSKFDYEKIEEMLDSLEKNDEEDDK